MANKLTREAEVVADALETLGIEVHVDDLVELVRKEVKWTANVGAHLHKLRTFSDDIMRSGRKGFYIHRKYLGKQEQVKPETKPLLEQVTPARIEVAAVTSKQETDNEQLLQNFRAATEQPFTFKVNKSNSHTRRVYKVGDMFEGRVSGIEAYGVFIEDWKNAVSGMVHRTQIRNGDYVPEFTDLLRDYHVGQLLQARIIGIRQDGRVALTFRDVPKLVEEPPAVSSMATALQIASEKKVVAEPAATPTHQYVMAEAPAPKGGNELERQLDELTTIIKSYVGFVSPAAKARMGKLLAESSAIRFSMALGQVAKDYQVDVSMMFVDEIEKKMRDSL